MFGRHFAYQFQNAGDEGWNPAWLHEEEPGPRVFKIRLGHRGPFGPWGRGMTPPWLHGEGPGPHFFHMRRGHGPGGPEGEWRGPDFIKRRWGRGPFGGFGPEGPGPEVHRFFARGDMKFALLELLRERPMHGYEMMKALEEKSGGFYTPSPGSIYPTLQMLEDRGFVSVQEVEGKKVYSITDAGQALLAERQKEEENFAGPPWMRRHGPGGQNFRPEMQALRSEAAEAGRLLSIAVRMSFQNPEQLARLRGIIERTRKDLSDMIYGANAQQTQPTPEQPEG
jgi:DNA-binding PadR family transcriptional regulator